MCSACCWSAYRLPTCAASSACTQTRYAFYAFFIERVLSSLRFNRLTYAPRVCLYTVPWWRC
jgi:hypothetical protein